MSTVIAPAPAPASAPAAIAFDNTYARLPERFYARLEPSRVPQPRLVAFNRPLAVELGIDPDALDAAGWAAIFAGNRIPEGAEPLAQAYAGHQFGQFVPQLGDGRAILLGEVIDRAGRRRDIQLKGSGRTPFSRRGDGRAALGPVLREYIVSEAMHALGIPTTRSLAAVTTGEEVLREEVLPGAVLARVAASHVRVGTFQFFAARGDGEALALLARHVIDRHYPQAREAERPALALLDLVAARQAALVARWLGVGFIHGVMNTDNMSIAGETIDYGPCAFMDAYDPGTVFSSIDQYGRYAYGNQPAIAQWNIARFAETLVPLIDGEEARAVELANEVLAKFPAMFDAAWLGELRRKLGLITAEPDDGALAGALLAAMQANDADFTRTFRRLCDAAEDPAADPIVRAGFTDPAAFSTWASDWRARLVREPQSPAERAAAMRHANPAFIPRNHRVEEALAAAIGGDLGPFERLNTVLARPHDEQPGAAAYGEPPAPGDRVYQTFCGT